jgi:hypothetical protein
VPPMVRANYPDFIYKQPTWQNLPSKIKWLALQHADDPAKAEQFIDELIQDCFSRSNVPNRNQLMAVALELSDKPSLKTFDDLVQQRIGKRLNILGILPPDVFDDFRKSSQYLDDILIPSEALRLQGDESVTRLMMLLSNKRIHISAKNVELGRVMADGVFSETQLNDLVNIIRQSDHPHMLITMTEALKKNKNPRVAALAAKFLSNSNLQPLIKQALFKDPTVAPRLMQEYAMINNGYGDIWGNIEHAQQIGKREINPFKWAGTWGRESRKWLDDVRFLNKDLGGVPGLFRKMFLPG